MRILLILTLLFVPSLAKASCYLNAAGNTQEVTAFNQVAVQWLLNSYLSTNGNPVFTPWTEDQNCAANVDVVAESSGNPATPAYVAGQRPFAATTTITRPANTTAYTAGAVWSTATSGLSAFPAFAMGIGNSQRGVINNIMVCSNNGAATTRGQFALSLFAMASPSGGGFNDGAAFAPTAAALAAVGNDLPGIVPSSLPMVTASPAAYCYNFRNDTGQFQTDGSGNLYAAVEVLNAYTPVSGEVLTITVSGLY